MSNNDPHSADAIPDIIQSFNDVARTLSEGRCSQQCMNELMVHTRYLKEAHQPRNCKCVATLESRSYSSLSFRSDLHMHFENLVEESSSQSQRSASSSSSESQQTEQCETLASSLPRCFLKPIFLRLEPSSHHQCHAHLFSFAVLYNMAIALHREALSLCSSQILALRFQSIALTNEALHLYYHARILLSIIAPWQKRNPVIAIALTVNLGHVYGVFGCLTDSENLYREALTMLIATRGREELLLNPSTAAIFSALFRIVVVNMEPEVRSAPAA